MSILHDDLEKEKQIISQVVLDSRDELEDILSDYTNFIEEDPDDKFSIREQIINNIFEYFLKIIYRLNRFSEFKSKIRVLEKGQSISQKEMDRCDFVVKLVNKSVVNIVKNNLCDINFTLIPLYIYLFDFTLSIELVRTSNSILYFCFNRTYVL